VREIESGHEPAIGLRKTQSNILAHPRSTKKPVEINQQAFAKQLKLFIAYK